jgi:phage pi2 protein 07
MKDNVYIIGFSKHLKGKIDALCGLLKLTIKYILMSHKTKMQSWTIKYILMSHKTKMQSWTIKYILMSHKTKMQSWQQGDIYYKPNTWFKNWILWVLVFRLQFFLLVTGVFHNFFWWVVGVKNICLPTPPHI